MPGPACTICTHPEAGAIDACLVGGVAYRTISGRHGVSLSSLSRHRRDHLSPALVAVGTGTATGTGTGTGAEHGTLVAQLRGLYRRVEGILVAAEADGRPSTALAAIREARSILETVARVTGELDERPVTVVNLVASPEWLAVQAAVLRALLPFPEARVAVADALDVVDADVVLELSS